MDDAGEDFPLGPVIVKLEGEFLEMLEQVLADIVDDLLPHDNHEPRPDTDA